MAKSSIAEKWLKSINSPKSEEDDPEKEVKKNNNSLNQDTLKSVPTKKTNEDNPKERFEGCKRSPEGVRQRGDVSEEECFRENVGEKSSAAQVWLRTPNSQKSEKDICDKDTEKNDSIEQARVIGVRDRVKEINALKSEHDISNPIRAKGKISFQERTIASHSDKDSSVEEFVGVRARVKEMFSQRPESNSPKKGVGEGSPQAPIRPSPITPSKLKNINQEKYLSGNQTWPKQESFAVSKELSNRQSLRLPEKYKTFSKEDIITLYENLEKVLRSKNYDENLRQELQKSNPDYLKVLGKRKADMERPDHSIVIAGETSAGKSTLINKILGKQIFRGQIQESTATVCKIRNFDKVKVVVENASGKSSVALTMDDLNSPEARIKLKNTLEKLTDMTVCQESKQHKSVDIGLPIPFLKDGNVLVDTPGIGGSGEVTEKLMEYIPNAVAFIFVIDVSSAGGLQRDRLPKILREIALKQIENEMPCFDPKEVLFITNKWDAIRKEMEEDIDDSLVEDEKAKVWKVLLCDIKEKWPSVKDGHIFKMNLLDVSAEASNPSVTEFKQFMETLKSNIEKAENKRNVHHLSFLRELLKNITQGLQARIQLNKMSEEEKVALLKKQTETITTLNKEIKKVREELLMKVKKQIEATAQSCYDYMSSDAGKEEILNPEGKKKVSDKAWNPTKFSKRVKKRVCKYIENLLDSEVVKNEFEQIKVETVAYYKKINTEVLCMESDWTDASPKETKALAKAEVDDDDDISTGSVVGVVVATSPIWIPLLAAGVGLVVAFAGVTVALSPVLISLNAFLGRDARKKKVIDEEYEKFKSTVRSTITILLESNTGAVLTKLIDKVTLELLPRQIQRLEEMLRQIKESRTDILVQRCDLLELQSQIRAIEEKADACIKYV